MTGFFVGLGLHFAWSPSVLSITLGDTVTVSQCIPICSACTIVTGIYNAIYIFHFMFLFLVAVDWLDFKSAKKI